jgi:hypothetical protein
MKDFSESLKDSFKHIKTITDPEQVKRLRSEGVLVDSEGIHVLEFGDNKEFMLSLEPIGEEAYLVSLYKNKVRIIEPLPVKPL